MTPLEAFAVATARQVFRRPDPLALLASAVRDFEINEDVLVKALASTTAGQAEEFAVRLHGHAAVLRDLETLALARAHRLGMPPLPFQETTR